VEQDRRCKLLEICARFSESFGVQVAVAQNLDLRRAHSFPYGKNMEISRSLRFGSLILVAAIVALGGGLAGGIAQSQLSAEVDFKVWTVPATPSGLVPTQSWLSIAASPEGDIFITGCDHKTNAALYRLSQKDQELRYVGDARSASEAVGNWRPGETAEKIHVRPIFLRGQLYLATADFTGSDDGYLTRRGFHWYAYDLAAGRLSDLSKASPGGVGGEHASVVALAVDPARGFVYGLDTPRGLLFRYDVVRGETTKLGKPSYYPEGHFMPGRYMWVSKSGRVYFAVSAVDHVLYFDPGAGWGEKKEWKIAVNGRSSKVFRTGAESADGKSIYMADVDGRIYCYEKEADTFEQIGQLTNSDPEFNSGNALKVRAFNVSRDGKRVYFVNDDAPRSAFWEWEIATNATHRLCLLSELDPQLGMPGVATHGGNESWDKSGRLYFCAFGNDLAHPTDLLLCRVNPEKLRVALAVNGTSAR
jgi:hypothetical protein